MSESPVEFFRHMEGIYAQMLAGAGTGTGLTQRLVGQAFDWFEQNIAIQTEGHPPLACDKGCPTCCSLRVTATAPEIFLMAQYIGMVEATPAGAALGMRARVQEAWSKTAGLNEQDRLSQAQPCPLMIEGMCIMHPVRTLACRGHAAFDVQGCRSAAAGEDVDVPISEPHLTLRGLVQNALQSALRNAGLPWGLYELNQGLALALEDPSREAAWYAGKDSLAPAIPDLDLAALGDAFDRLHVLH